MDFLFCIGTIAEWIKMKKIIFLCEKNNLNYKIYFTNQHNFKIDDIFKNKVIYSNVYFLKKNNNKYIEAMIFNIKTFFDFFKYILKKNPKKIIIHGDTMSSLLCCISATFSKIFNLKRKIYHVEGGLRSFDLLSPFPEELNRIIIDFFSDTLFCPSKYYISKLPKFYFKIKEIEFTGQTAVDNLINFKNLKNRKKNRIIVKIHRVENLNEKEINNLYLFLKKLSKKFKIIWVVNDYILKIFSNLKIKKNIEKKFILKKRMEHTSFLNYVLNSKLIITDSGGEIIEFCYLEFPLISFRKKTEQKDLFKYNYMLRSKDEKEILKFIKKIENPSFKFDKYDGIYGNGNAYIKIYNILTKND